MKFTLPKNPKLTKDKRLGLLTIALDNPPPPDGAAPDLNELIAWQQGRVSRARADEIKSHVARDPDTYALWQQARASEKSAKPGWFTLPPWLCLPKHWTMGAYPLAIAAALMLAVGLPRLWPTPTLSMQLDNDYQTLAPLGLNATDWLPGFASTEKSLALPPSAPSSLSPLKLPINVGIRQGLQDLTASHKLDKSWLDALRFYPPLQTRCPDGQDCGPWLAVLKDFGRWLALNRLQCMGKQITIETLRQPNKQLSHFLGAAAAYQELAGLKQLLEQWQMQTPDEPAQFCRNIAALLKQLNT